MSTSPENYYDSIAQHIKNCTVFLLFVSYNSVKSLFVSEKELLFADRENKTMCFCQLDKDAEFTGEAKDIITFAASSERNPKTDEKGLEEVLGSIKGLERYSPRKAEGFKTCTYSHDIVLAEKDDEFEFIVVDGGILLTQYKGSRDPLIIPGVYKGQKVLGIGYYFKIPKPIRTLIIDDRIDKINLDYLDSGHGISDVYIGVHTEVYYSIYRDKYGLNIHCLDESNLYIEIEDLSVWDYGYYDYKQYFSAPSKQASEYDDHIMGDDYSVEMFDRCVELYPDKSKKEYAFCDYADDVKDEAEKIIGLLAENSCSVISANPLNEAERGKLLRSNNCKCVIAFISREYIESGRINYVYFADAVKKKCVKYFLDDTPIPDDMFSTQFEQYLSYEQGTYQDRLSKLTNYLDECDCREKVASIKDYNYTTDLDGNVIITKYTGKEDKDDIVIPDEFEGHAVTSLNGVFSISVPSIQSVTIPDSVISITDSFNFSDIGYIGTVKIGKGVRNISDCFRSNRIDKIIIDPENPWLFEKNGMAFYKSEQDNVLFCLDRTTKEIVFPDNATHIGNNAFSGCSGLESVTIPDSVTYIGDYAFLNCSGLESVIIPDGVTHIGSKAFYNCSGLKSVTIPDSVTHIGSFAFCYCFGLGSVIIPDSVTHIGDYAFSDCSGLKSIILPKGVTNIGSRAFSDCSGLESITIQEGDITFGKQVFDSCTNLKLVRIMEGANICETPYTYLFANCDDLSSIVIPDSMTELNSILRKNEVTYYCNENTPAWNYLEKTHFDHKPLSELHSTL